ncbi:MAG TPA: hypothetical protein VNA30_05505 [Mycobacteriales bacterium]|nr:hypothetical protein [Mycobacteriales bacterium]
MSATPLRIDARYSGPPVSANGGVTAGLLAERIAGEIPSGSAVEVTLRRPPPLDTDLRVVGGQLLDGELLIAEAVASDLDLAPMPAVSVEDAVAAASSYAGLTTHPFPGCFVCGTDREPPDGLGLRPGAVADGVVAAAWTPAADLPVMLWAALDCPGAWATDLAGRALVLGRITLRQLGPVLRDQPHVVQGWVLGGEGRKTHTATALYDAAGSPRAIARATWFAVDVDKVGIR